MKIHPIIFLILGLILLGGLFFLFKPQAENTTTDAKPTLSIEQEEAKDGMNENESEIMKKKKTFSLIIEEGKINFDQQIVSVIHGDTVILQITADEAEEFHLHGYDISVDLEPGIQKTLEFVADKTGRFPYELEHSQKELGALEVQPKN